MILVTMWRAEQRSKESDAVIIYQTVKKIFILFGMYVNKDIN